MKAVILAAGIGQRLNLEEPIPKILLRFGGETLLARHCRFLRNLGVAGVELAVGFRAEAIEAEIDFLGVRDFVSTRFNQDYRRGAIASLWTLREAFQQGEPILFMDGDVLYGQELLARLIDTPHPNCHLMDREIEPGEDPVKLCLRDGLLVDFHKRPRVSHDGWGEWVGFSRFDGAVAAKIAAAADRYVEAGRLDEIYEEAFRDVLLNEPAGTFRVEDITGLPWIEIDFPEDLETAKTEILPRLQTR